MVKIRNIHIQNFLQQNGLKAINEKDGIQYYNYSNQLEQLMDRYYIEFLCIPNKI